MLDSLGTLMVLDTRTLFMMTWLLTLVIGVCLLATARKEYPGATRKSMRLWGLAYLIQTMGWLFGGLRGYIPDFLSIVLVNSLLLWSQVEIYHALCIFDEQQPRRKLSYVLLFLGLTACWILLYVPGSLPTRIVIVSLVSVIFSVMSGLQLTWHQKSKPGRGRQILASGFWLMVLIYVLRIIITLGPEASIPSVLANSPMQTLSFGGTALSVITISIGFLLMCTENFSNALLRLATVDDLTGLSNRREIERLTQKVLDLAHRANQPLAFLLMDADNFKTINDTYGHLAGDMALQVIADTIIMNLRAAEIVGRLGGDEFVVVLPNTEEEAAFLVAEQLASAVNEAPFYVDGERRKLSISFGIAMFTVGAPDYARLVRMADIALYAMKREKVELRLQPLP